ncbi:hypothetical protein PVAP13_5KG143307 [Panicum virgatum]|uniref:Uncharacterized protein n=1 Tax=Panicum virgatum TaxID=38727 RepID=A0A8T0SIN5_PANVG|nr:hypothetical protein PVAP13_5KG143307 [Panicum virgatum]
MFQQHRKRKTDPVAVLPDVRNTEYIVQACTSCCLLEAAGLRQLRSSENAFMLYNTAAAFYLRDFVSELSDFCIIARCTESSRGWCGGRGRLRAARLVRTSACLFDLLSAGIAGPGLSRPLRAEAG